MGDTLGTVLAVGVPVLLVWSYHATFRSRVRLLNILLLLVLSVAAVWQAHRYGPGWGVVLAYAGVGVGILVAAATFVRAAAAVTVAAHRPYTPEQLAEVVRSLAGAPGALLLTIAVSPGGKIMVVGGEDEPRTLVAGLTEGCPLCFVEARVRELAGADTPAVAAYRERISARANHSLVLTRAEPADPWGWKLRPTRPGFAYRTSTCPVHAD
ncbi:hypothetical protein [Longispora urticae]